MRIAVVITARPSYAKAKTVIQALVKRGADVTIFACASALLERYGKVVDVIRKDFPDVPIEEVWSTYEGATLLTSAKETGSILDGVAGQLRRTRPAVVCVVADRHEVLGAAQAAAYQHYPLAHVQGGERTGSIDDRVRDSITQLADIHCTSTERARWRVYGLTGSSRIYNTGCPSIDLARVAQSAPAVTIKELGGVGCLDPEQPFLIVLQHPVTNEACAAQQMDATLDAILRIDLPRLVMWPGEDAGQEAMAKRIRLEQNQGTIHTLRNLPPERFLKLLTQASVLVGNSSAGIRESAYLGVPVVNIGSRQQSRERAANVLDVGHDVSAITCAIRHQLDHGVYPSSPLYGRGDAGERIAEILCRTS